VLVVSGSMRERSLNTRLAKLAADALEREGVEVDHGAMREFDCPSYDGDGEDTDGVPEGARELCRRLERVHGFVIASPEYNAAMPGVLKNAIDWTSRLRPQPFHLKHALLMSASPSMVGGNRGLWSLRVPLEHLGATVYPDMFSLAQAHETLDGDGRIASDMLRERFDATIHAWSDLVEASTHYACAKARWFEFLGERPPASIDRVE
jgi:NAD(P)H-dependent FMN reductase